MWELLFTLVPAATLSAPFLFPAVRHKAREAVGTVTRAVTGGSGEIAVGAFIQKTSGEEKAKAIEAAAPKSASSNLDAPEKGFSAALTELKQRALENENHEIYSHLQELVEELQSLHTKLKDSEAGQQARLLYTKYLPALHKVNEITGPKYYGEFVRNPGRWDDPQGMRMKVELSVASVAEKATEDIRRLNTSRALNFNVSVDALLGSDSSGETRAKPSIEGLLGSESSSQASTDEVTDELSSLEALISSESAALKEKEELEAKEIQAAKLEAQRKRGGTKREIEARDKIRKSARPTLFTKEFFSQSTTIYGPGNSENDYLVGYKDHITGEFEWKNFSSTYEAADWVDSVVVREQKKHDFKCDCVYCSPAKEAAKAAKK